MPARHPPTLLFDGDCEFCRVQARRAERLAGDRVQVVAYNPQGYPEIEAAAARAALQFLDAEGRGHAGADAVVAFWRHAQPRWAFLSALYRLPGVRTIAQRIYAIVARKRSGTSSYSR
jgi:predicted DCC family thiol-disulfide oxidoreductase YuxK